MKQGQQYYYLCNVCTEYSLFLYLLFMSLHDIQHTFFVFNPYGISKNIIAHFKDSYTMPNYNKWNIIKQAYITIGGWIHFRILKKKYLPNMDKIAIYGNDISRYDSILIGHHTYSLIEDGAKSLSQSYWGFFKQFDDFYQSKWYYKIMKWLYGPTYYCRFGNNRLCTDIYTTDQHQLWYPPSKYIHHININQLWTQDPEKQKYILNIFNLSNDDVRELTKRKMILFTQPLYPDFISLQTHQQLYDQLIKKYDNSELVIKPHPRDKFNYEHYYPLAFVYKKNVPSQILDLIGIRYERAITFFSSAVKSFSYSIDIDWYGDGNNSTLKEKLKFIESPRGIITLTL